MVNAMYHKQDMAGIRNNIKQCLGSRVRLESNKGKHHSTVNVGVIASVYPSIFTVQLFDGIAPTRLLSFSYTDVLTNAVEITLCE